jgi:ubiquinone/menaquinone biosynthesis C-methylase UbiE
LVGFATSNSNPGAGADIVMESITLIDRVVSIDACLQEYVRVASLHVKRNPVCKPDGIMAGHVLGTMAHNRMNDNVTQSIRESYDRLADEYARRIFNELQQKPLDRELLSRFAAEIARGGEVCDIGCGPGHVARYLHDAGAAIFGLDISPRMLAQARQLNPDISFHEGNMMALDLQDGTLAGISAFYAIVNIPKTSLPSVFREMRRVLQPGGLLLLAFHTGDEILHEDELWGRHVSMDFFLFPPLAIQRHLEAAGFAIEEIIEREPYPPEVEYQSRRAYIFARKPGRLAQCATTLPTR